jgi:hypothetical protein
MCLIVCGISYLVFDGLRMRHSLRKTKSSIGDGPCKGAKRLACAAWASVLMFLATALVAQTFGIITGWDVVFAWCSFLLGVALLDLTRVIISTHNQIGLGDNPQNCD